MCFFHTHDRSGIIKWPEEISSDFIPNWNREISEHVKKFNLYQEDRNIVIYFALLLEDQINNCLNILFVNFKDKFDSNGIQASMSLKIKILYSIPLFTQHIFDSLNCINDIRNEFAHNIYMESFSDFNRLSKKKRTLEKLIQITEMYEGNYKYHEIDDTPRNRFKSLSLNLISYVRANEIEIKKIRKSIENIYG